MKVEICDCFGSIFIFMFMIILIMIPLYSKGGREKRDCDNDVSFVGYFWRRVMPESE